VPSPDGCTIDNVTPLGGLNYSISCVIGNDRLVPDYIALLIADGFAETNRMETQSGQLISVDLEKNNIQVSILLSISGVLVINVSEKP
ncbi:MAG: hypothetical protein JW704_03330, partial [Anaerolineaceae bacterium]|nr:hypothetical protein [Anaerolineaceae bacterium]